MSTYITGVGSYLPGEPIGNDEIETYLGQEQRIGPPGAKSVRPCLRQ